MWKALSPEQIPTSPSLLLHLWEPDGRVSPPASPRGGRRVGQQGQTRCSSPYLEEPVQQEGEPVRQHLLGHRLGPGGGRRAQTSHTEPPNLTCPRGSGMSPALSLWRRQPPPSCPPVPALPGLPTASLVTLSSSHVAQITAWLSKSLGFTAAPGNQGQPSDNGSEIAAFSPVPPSVLSPHCARDYL